MKYRTLSTLALTSTVLSSCIYYTDPVPEMPYRPYRPNPVATQPTGSAAYLAASQYESAWHTTGPTTMIPTATPYSGATVQPVAPAPAPLPAPKVETTPPKPTTAITQPQLKLNPVTPKPAAAASTPKPSTPAVKPATPAPKPASSSASVPYTKDTTNTGPIPVATPVPGDPTRVYNPLDSSKTIRITDKNGKIYPSGKELKVRGTNFHFYVP